MRLGPPARAVVALVLTSLWSPVPASSQALESDSQPLDARAPAVATALPDGLGIVFRRAGQAFLFLYELDSAHARSLLAEMPESSCLHADDRAGCELPEALPSALAAAWGLLPPPPVRVVGPLGPVPCEAAPPVVLADLSDFFGELSLAYPLDGCAFDPATHAPVALLTETASATLRWVPGGAYERASIGDTVDLPDDPSVAQTCAFGRDTHRGRAQWRTWQRRQELGWASLRSEAIVRSAVAGSESFREIDCGILWSGHATEQFCFPPDDAVELYASARGVLSDNEWLRLPSFRETDQLGVLAEGDRIAYALASGYGVTGYRRTDDGFEPFDLRFPEPDCEGPCFGPALELTPTCGH